jgi:HTH-type transcriptional repressor of NAD biosynthesis genes
MKQPPDERAERGAFAWYGGGWNDEGPPLPEPPDALHRSGPHAASGPTDDATRQHVGVILGRFRPPHMGHLFLVEQAFARCGALTILSPGKRFSPAMQRIEDAFAGYAAVVACAPPPISDPADPAFATAWAAMVRAAVPQVTRVFSSDPDGAAAVARALGVEHIVIDAARQTHRVSSTQIRAELARHFRFIAPGARPSLAVHVGLVGVESSGKTTLAQALARSIGAAIVDDPLRGAPLAGDGMPGAATLEAAAIGLEQRRRRAAEGNDAGVVVIDGCAITTMAWAARARRAISARFRDVVRWEHCDVWLFCEDDFGFVGPGARDEPEARATMKAALREQLATRAHVVTVAGDHATRLQTALTAIEAARARMQAALAATPD